MPREKSRGAQKKINSHKSNESIPFNMNRGLAIKRVYFCPSPEQEKHNYRVENKLYLKDNPCPGD